MIRFGHSALLFRTLSARRRLIVAWNSVQHSEIVPTACYKFQQRSHSKEQCNQTHRHTHTHTTHAHTHTHARTYVRTHTNLSKHATTLASLTGQCDAASHGATPGGDDVTRRQRRSERDNRSSSLGTAPNPCLPVSSVSVNFFGPNVVLCFFFPKTNVRKPVCFPSFSVANH